MNRRRFSRKRALVFLGLSLVASGVRADLSPIADGDALYPDRMQVEANRQALEHYRAAIQQDPQRVEAHWKASRAAWWLGTRRKDRASRLAAFEEGMRLAETAIRMAPDRVEPHFWLGGNYASYGETKGAFTSLMLIKKIRKEMAEVNRIDERYMEAGGHRILAILDYKVPGIVGGNHGRAWESFQKALAIAPNNPVTLFYLADYYHASGKDREALETLNRFDALTPSPDFSAEFLMMKELALPLRQKLRS